MPRVKPHPTTDPLPLLPKEKARARVAKESTRTQRRIIPPLGFAPLRRVKGTSSDLRRGSNPDCAAPSGFLNLLTPSSARTSTALFHAESALGVEAFRGFPLPVAATAHRCALPPELLAAVSVETTHSGDYCIWKVRSRWSGVTRIPSADPLLAFVPFEVSLRASASCRYEASSHGLVGNAEQARHCHRSPEFQRTQRSNVLFQEHFPSMGFASFLFG